MDGEREKRRKRARREGWREEANEGGRECLRNQGLESASERCRNQWTVKRHLDSGEYRRVPMTQ